VWKLSVFVMLFAVWLVLSGHFDPLHLALGLVCSALVAQCSSGLLLTDKPSLHLLAATWGAVWFLPWLLYEIIVANLHLVYLVSLVSHIFRTTPATIGSQRGPVATAS
jgi:multicomponent Na+:H+ antiporter subunit E